MNNSVCTSIYIFGRILDRFVGLMVGGMTEGPSWSALGGSGECARLYEFEAVTRRGGTAELSDGERSSGRRFLEDAEGPIARKIAALSNWACSAETEDFEPTCGSDIPGLC
jgi:hypothetical protein